MPLLLSRRSFIQAAASAAALASSGGVASAAERSGSLDRVVRVAVHPALGVARVGNSPDAFFLAPEVSGTTPIGPFKDPEGAMARQAARFRIFGYDRDGQVVAEITEADASITWRVRLGNAKAAWYGADEPLDLPSADPMPLRNPDVADRASLAIVSAWRRVSGAASTPVSLDGGAFMGSPVTLGEILTDERGRLLVMPGSGSAVKGPNAPPLEGFADNDGWTDTTSDGPVQATVRIGDRVLEADPGWVLCGSPNYGPGMAAGVVTLYDTAFSSLVLAGRRKRPRTEYHRDIAPIFERITDMQWVNAGYLTTNGFGSLRDWTTPQWQERLSDSSRANDELRGAILSMFRDAFYGVLQPGLAPNLYGDMVSVGVTQPTDPRQWLAVSPVQYAHLRAWAKGDFTVGPDRSAVRSVDELPLRERPRSLDRSALDGCLGGAFHPGVEFPWISRTDWIWTDDLRLATPAALPDLRTPGPVLTPAVATSPTGPLSSIGPGDLVKWMGVPWQADSASCRFGYQKPVSPVLPGFWPARIPNSVLAEDDYRVVMDSTRTLDDRRAAFRTRHEWERFIASPNRLTTLSMMVDEWFKLGVVRKAPGPADGAFPATMLVESRVGFPAGSAQDFPAWSIRPQMSLFPLVVTNSDDSTLRTVDAQGGGGVLGLPGAIARPEGIARDPLGRLIVAAMNGRAVIGVARDGSVETVATVPDQPLGVAVDPNGMIYACGIGDGGWVASIDPSGKVKILLTAATGASQPHALGLAPDGALLISNNLDGTIARYDPLLRTMLDRTWITGLARPKNMAWDSDGALYIVERGANRVHRADQDGRQLPFTLEGTSLNEPFGIAYDGLGALYVSSASASANRIDRIVLAGDRGTVSVFATGMTNPGGVVFNP
jgi:sugar lactone lactonase YvrE